VPAGDARKRSPSRPRIVADTMVWVAATVGQAGSVSRALLDAFVAGDIEIVSSGPLVRELADVLIELDRPADFVERIVALICAHAEIVAIQHQVMGCADPKDDPSLETALTGRADYVVTLDKRLLQLPPHVAEYFQRRGVSIVKPGGFAALVGITSS